MLGLGTAVARTLALATALAAGAAACNNASFQGAKNDAPATSPAPAPAPTTEGPKPKTKTTYGAPGSEPTDDGETADRPALVSGAYLTCVQVEERAATAAAPADDGADAYGCRVEQNGAKLSLARHKTTWSVATPQGQALKASDYE